MDHEEEDNEGGDADEVEAEGENNGGRGGSAGVVVAGVLLPLILLAVTATITVVVFLVWRRRYSYTQCSTTCVNIYRRESKSLDYCRSLPARLPPPFTNYTTPATSTTDQVHYIKSQETVQNTSSECAPMTK